MPHIKFLPFLILLLSLQLQAQELSGKVVAVKDGDTIELRTESGTLRIRLAGIDCPESKQAFGNKAKQFTREACFGKTVTVKTSGTDKYGRTIGEVFLPDGRSLNRELVSAGFAWWYWQPSTDIKLGAFEYVARQSKIGLWAEPNPVAPWEYRRGARKSETFADPHMKLQFQQEYVPAKPQTPIKLEVGQVSFIGCKNARIFHVSTCLEISKMRKLNTVVFKSADDAVKAGFVGCKLCNPMK